MAIEDVTWTMVILFTLGVAFFFIFFFMEDIKDNMSNVKVMNETASAKTALLNMDKVTTKMDLMFASVLVGIILMIAASSYFIGGEPFFIIVYVLIWLISLAISPILSNAWEDITLNAAFGVTIQNFPIANHILLNLPFYVLGMGFLGFILMYITPYQMGSRE